MPAPVESSPSGRGFGRGPHRNREVRICSASDRPLAGVQHLRELLAAQSAEEIAAAQTALVTLTNISGTRRGRGGR
jgi:hypothetical protein